MGRVLLLCGHDATTPYRFQNPDIYVYCVEELCFVLKQNAFLLDADIMNKTLVSWLDQECGLHDLANELYPMIHKKGTVSAFVLTILEYVGIYDEEELREVEELLKQGANLSAYEKYKTRVDRMVASGRYANAIEEYDKLLETLPDMETEIRAKVLHNKAVALANLFLFDKSAKFFKESFDMYPLPETLVEYLASMRMLLSEDDYLAFVAGIPEAYEESLELEHKVEELALGWEQHIERQRLNQMQEWKQSGERSKYYQEADRVLQALKHSYRYSIGDI
ncbi:MAG: hypothetical protein IJW63_03355 [Lachnospiraceae bacterium]|nr:hypothetical protein [Lachnospiraceae bacterium]